MQFPDGGELFKAREKKSEHLIFFAHFFKGHKKALRRHIDFVNELGFDAYAFNLKDDLKDHFYVPYSHSSKKFGMKHALAEQIGQHLELTSDYQTKIIYAFSNVAGCAIEAHTLRLKEGKNDVVAMVCDSGPGAGNFFQSSYMLLQEQIGVESLPLKLMATPAVAFGWSPKLNQDISKDLQSFPEGFPILSIRGWRDRLISPTDIDKVFDHHTNLNWKKLALPEAGHLNGLRDFPSEYKPGVEDFLNQFLN